MCFMNRRLCSNSGVMQGIIQFLKRNLMYTMTMSLFWFSHRPEQGTTLEYFYEVFAAVSSSYQVLHNNLSYGIYITYLHFSMVLHVTRKVTTYLIFYQMLETVHNDADIFMNDFFIISTGVLRFHYILLYEQWCKLLITSIN